MILKALTLENFKGIREPVRIEFAPLTLLFGPNNAGKSTIVQALMYAREVLERNNCDAGRTQLGGDVVDLGGFQNLVYGHDPSGVIRMRFELDLRKGKGAQESDWVRQNELESHVGFFYRDVPKELDVASAERMESRLVESWVEFEIAWCNTKGHPLVRTYAVGIGAEEYARISLDSDTGKASLTYFNFGLYPFGTLYSKGDSTHFEWAFEQATRRFLRTYILHNDLPDLDLKKGAYIAMDGEEVDSSENRLSRERFDEIVNRIIAGEGDWGDPTIDKDSGEHKPNYVQRQKLIEFARMEAKLKDAVPKALASGFLDDLAIQSQKALEDQVDAAERIGEAKASVESFGDLDTQQVDTSDALPDSTDQDDPPDDHWEDRMERLIYDDDRGIDSWLLEFFVALIRDGFIPVDPDCAVPLSQHSSALPEWGRTLDLEYSIWMPDKWNYFWDTPAFAQEYLRDLLTVAIVKPGECLLRALQDTVYVSPFRAMPPRHYQPARSPEAGRWADGLAAWDWLLLKDTNFAGRVNQWLSDPGRFNSGYEIDSRRYLELDLDGPLLYELSRPAVDEPLDRNWLQEELSTLREGRRLQIRNLRSGVTLFPQDLGVGVSQIVPVIVAALHNNSGIVAIEEPESNIHPAFQVVLADLFITQAKENPDVLLLVETHSEHLMLRCLRRIRETSEGEVEQGIPDVQPEDIAVHFVEADNDGPRIHRIRIDEDGEFLDPWPRGFFRERARELFG